MQDCCQDYLETLRSELEILEEDVIAMVDDHHRRKQAGEITNYVYMENTAVLGSMLASVRGLLGYLHTVDGTMYSGVHELASVLDRSFRERTRERGFPTACYAIARRTLDEVTRHMVGAAADNP